MFSEETCPAPAQSSKGTVAAQAGRYSDTHAESIYGQDDERTAAVSGMGVQNTGTLRILSERGSLWIP